MSATFRLPVASAGMVRTLLAGGQRIAAAAQAELLAEDASESVREVVRILADELRECGDKHASRGRPKGELAPQQRGQRALAVRDYRAAIYARFLIDDDNLSAGELSSLAWLLGGLAPEGVDIDGLFLEERHRVIAVAIARDISAARAALTPYALALLKRCKLHPSRTARRGFRDATRRRVAAHWGISVSVLKRELAQ